MKRFYLFTSILCFCLGITAIVSLNCSSGSRETPAVIAPQTGEAQLAIPFNELRQIARDGSSIKTPDGTECAFTITEITPINAEDLPESGSYQDLDKFKRNPSSGDCTSGTKTCSLLCIKSKTRIIITGIPGSCYCDSDETSLDIICTNGCSSYSIRCGAR